MLLRSVFARIFMKAVADQIRLAATDLSNHLGCRHLTFLDLSVARGLRAAPEVRAPDLKIIQELGLRHEAAYLTYLTEQEKLLVVNLQNIREEQKLLAETKTLIQQ